jgi:hypothetical protein
MHHVTDVENRKKRALDAVQRAFGTEGGEEGVDLFVQHHLEELPASYWQQHLGSGIPEPAAVVGLLQLRSTWGERDIEYFDFTLPDGVTDYVVSVHFDAAGAIDAISMES